MNDFTIRFVELCGRERALYDPSHTSEIEAAAERISRALQQLGFSFGPGKVKPMFDRVRVLYEEELVNRADGRFSELKWFHSMDVYMRPIVRVDIEDTSSDKEQTIIAKNKESFTSQRMGASSNKAAHLCSNDVQEVEKVTEGIEFTDDAPWDEKVTEGIEFAGDTPCDEKVTEGIEFAGDTPCDEKVTEGIEFEDDTPCEGKVTEGIEFADDTPCDVCRSAFPEDMNDMIFCNMCEVCVHQACYGVPVVPDDDWYCRPCQLKIKPSCALCPKEGGAMKSTRDGRQWAHVSCAWWIKEVRIGCSTKMEPIDGISNIPLSRWNLVCSLCRVKYGACIQCVECSCTVAYHVTCAFDKGLRMDMCDDPEIEDGVKLLSYCWKHGKSVGNSKSGKKQKSKKKTRRSSSDIESPWNMPRPPHQMSIRETVTSILNGNELLEAESTSDGNSQSSAVDSSTTQSSASSEVPTIHGKPKPPSSALFETGSLPTSETGPGHQITRPVHPCPDDPNRKTAEPSQLLNGTKNGNKTIWNMQTTVTQPPRESFEGHSHEMPKSHRRPETGRDGPQTNFDLRTSGTKNGEPSAEKEISYNGEPFIKHLVKASCCSKSFKTQNHQQIPNSFQPQTKNCQLHTSSGEGPPAKRIRLLESSRRSLPLTQAKNKSIIDTKPSTATHKRQISFYKDLSATQQPPCSGLPHAAEVTHKTTLKSHQYTVQNNSRESFIDPINMRQGKSQLICSNFVPQGRQQAVTADGDTTMQNSLITSCCCEMPSTTQSNPLGSFSTQSHEIESNHWPKSVQDRPTTTQIKHCSHNIATQEEYRSPFKSKPSASQKEHHSPFNNKPTAVEKEHCPPIRNQLAAIHEEEYCSPFKNHLSATEKKHCIPCKHHAAAKQDKYQLFNEQLFAMQHEHCSPSNIQPSTTQEKSCLLSTSALQNVCYASVREQTSSGSFIQKETIESKSTTKRHSKPANYEQLTKFITVHLQSVSPQMAKQLERKIIGLCLKSRRANNENPKKD